jgi:hypothetical protein
MALNHAGPELARGLRQPREETATTPSFAELSSVALAKQEATVGRKFAPHGRLRRSGSAAGVVGALSAIGKSSWFACGFFAAASLVRAGPPFATDDPVPVEYRHWEFYVATQYSCGPDGAAGTGPHFELNYGLAPDLQIHAIAPFAFDAPSGANRHYGYGDTELGVKYRFLQEAKSRPQVGVFPLVELPTGNQVRGLGSGHTQIFLPVWLQKSAGAWTTYGGAGYWINPGRGHRDWWFLGWLAQKQVRPNLALGVEVFHETPQTIDGRADTKANVGLIWDLDKTRHFLASAGPTLRGPHGYQVYFALQFTSGPGE